MSTNPLKKSRSILSKLVLKIGFIMLIFGLYFLMMKVVASKYLDNLWGLVILGIGTLLHLTSFLLYFIFEVKLSFPQELLLTGEEILVDSALRRVDVRYGLDNSLRWNYFKYMLTVTNNRIVWGYKLVGFWFYKINFSIWFNDVNKLEINKSDSAVVFYTNRQVYKVYLDNALEIYELLKDKVESFV